ncbi:MAG: DUF4190 domain-containing protein [Lachnospiraceae bacterium]|nr:DUF4190 domain-containing protein [Lachnospiraceae bacterium]
MNEHQNGSGGGLAVAALVCGILGLVGGSIPYVRGFTGILAVLAIIFGIIARKTAPADKRTIATAGLILGIIAVAVTILGLICFAAVCGGLMQVLLDSPYW